jgi:hypothetical protein
MWDCHTSQNEVPGGSRFPFLFIRPFRTALNRQLDLYIA